MYWRLCRQWSEKLIRGQWRERIYLGFRDMGDGLRHRMVQGLENCLARQGENIGWIAGRYLMEGVFMG